jgi:excisionase family DNA binding protein
MDDLITPAEAARMRSVTRSAITDLIKRGRLQAVEVGGRRFLHRKDVERFTPVITGRPPGKAPTANKAATGAAKASNAALTAAAKAKKKGKK